jgi:hypothetical protein
MKAGEKISPEAYHKLQRELAITTAQLKKSA